VLTTESLYVHFADSSGAYETVRPVEQNGISDVARIIPEVGGIVEEIK